MNKEQIIKEFKEFKAKFNDNKDGITTDMFDGLEEVIKKLGKYIILVQEEECWVAYYNAKPFQQPVGLTAIDTFMTQSAEGKTPLEAVSNLLYKIK